MSESVLSKFRLISAAAGKFVVVRDGSGGDELLPILLSPHREPPFPSLSLGLTPSVGGKNQQFSLVLEE